MTESEKAHRKSKTMTSVLLERNAAMMTHQNGFDVVIVCTNTENMASVCVCVCVT